MKIKFLYLITACALLLTAFTVFEKNKSFQEENYFILHYTPGTEWEHEKPPNEQAFFAEHSRFLASLRATGRAKIGGRYSDKGMIIFSARDRTQADSLLSTDPSVPNGTFQAEIYPISFFYRGSIPEPATTNTKSMDPIITQTAILNTTAEEAFKMFTENELLESWLTLKADVEPEPGGKYELFWEPDDPENNSTIGCKVLAVESPHYINFEWKGPKEYKHFMNDAQPLTNVTVTFTPIENGTIVTLIHTGWRETANWEEARQYFISAWNSAFRKLEKVVNTTVLESQLTDTLAETNKPRVTGIGGIFFKSEDPQKLKEWYNKHLGLQTDQWGTNFEWRQANEGTQKGFTQWSPFSETTTYFEPSAKNFMINYRVVNLESLIEELKSEGVTILSEIGEYEYGKFVHILDLEGNKVELWEPDDVEYDKIVDGRTK